MAGARTSIVIRRPSEDVFAVISDIEKNPLWSRATVEARRTSPGPAGVGATARVVGSFLGRRVETDSEIVEFEPGRRLVARSTSGPFPYRLAMTVEPVPDGSRLEVLLEGEPGGFFRLADSLLVSVGMRQLEGDLANLRDLMEADAL